MTPFVGDFRGVGDTVVAIRQSAGEQVPLESGAWDRSLPITTDAAAPAGTVTPTASTIKRTLPSLRLIFTLASRSSPKSSPRAAAPAYLARNDRTRSTDAWNAARSSEPSLRSRASAR